MRILLVTDAWAPQVNGVVVTLTRTVEGLRAMGHEIEVIGPDRFRTIPCPSYPEIRLAIAPYARLSRFAQAFEPHAVHIATEGPLGQAARKWCLVNKQPFTTAYHTRFPEYVHARTRLPVEWTYAWLRRFHAPAQAVMVPTGSIEDDLRRRGFRHLARWSRGVDAELFKPGERLDTRWPRPVHMYVGRVAVEKNLDAFLRLRLPGSKVIVGDGPQRTELESQHRDAHFVGTQRGEQLAAHFRSADVFVFPSRTDTFGLVLLEAMASGTPVAAYPVPGPLDVVDDGHSGILHDDLAIAARRALLLDRSVVRSHALQYSWERANDQFLRNLRPAHALVA